MRPSGLWTMDDSRGPRRPRHGWFALLLVAAGLLALLAAATASWAQTPPPSSGDWTISDTTTIANQRVDLRGSLIVRSQGTLTLTNVDLRIHLASEGSEGITVEGRMTMSGGSINSTSDDHYRFQVSNGARLRMDRVTVSDMWQNQGGGTGIRGGLQLYSDDVILRNCTLTENDRVGITVMGASPVIEDCVIEKSAYYTFNRYWYFVERDAYGIWCRNAHPTVRGCTIRECGDYDMAFEHRAGLQYTYLRLNAYGVISHSGSITLIGTTFSDIGRTYEDTTKEVWIPEQGINHRYYMYFDTARAVVWSDSNVVLNITDCTFKDNYAGDRNNADAASIVYATGGETTITGSEMLRSRGNVLSLSNMDLAVSNTTIVDFTRYALECSGNGESLVEDVVINGTGGTRVDRYVDGLYFPSHADIAVFRRVEISSVAGMAVLRSCPHVEFHDSVFYNVSWMFNIYRGVHLYCYNTTVSAEDFTTSIPDTCVVDIYWYLTVRVTWQSGLPVANPTLMLTNAEGSLLLSRQLGEDGELRSYACMRTRLTGFNSPLLPVNNSLLTASAVVWGVDEGELTFPFLNNTDVRVVLRDRSPPRLVVESPRTGQIQNFSALGASGMAWDDGSGIDRIEVSVDGGEWLQAGTGPSWTLLLNLTEGVHRITAKATDRSGLATEVEVPKVIIDMTPPHLEVVSPVDGLVTNSRRVRVNGTAEMNSTIMVQGELVELISGTFSHDVQLRTDGIHSITVMAMDEAGNQVMVMREVLIDTIPPDLIVEHPTQGMLTNEPSLTVRGRVDRDATLFMDDVPIGIEDGTFERTISLDEGTNAIELVAEDDAGNRREFTLFVFLDTEPPFLELVTYSPYLLTNVRRITVIFRCGTDATEVTVNMVHYRGGGGIYQVALWFQEGENELVIEAFDKAGNVARVRYTIIVDTVPPILEVLSPADRTIVKSPSVIVEGLVEDATVVTIDGEYVHVEDGHFNVTVALNATELEKDIVVMAVDEAGNEAVVVRHVFYDVPYFDYSIDSLPNSTLGSYIEINGTIGPPGAFDGLYINDVRIEPGKDGTFSIRFPLELGVNTYKVKIVDNEGNVKEETLTVERIEPRKVVEEEGIGAIGWAVAVVLFIVGLMGGLGFMVLLRRGRGGPEAPAPEEEGPVHHSLEPPWR